MLALYERHAPFTRPLPTLTFFPPLSPLMRVILGPHDDYNTLFHHRSVTRRAVLWSCVAVVVRRHALYVPVPGRHTCVCVRACVRACGCAWFCMGLLGCTRRATARVPGWRAGGLGVFRRQHADDPAPRCVFVCFLVHLPGSHHTLVFCNYGITQWCDYLAGTSKLDRRASKALTSS